MQEAPYGFLIECDRCLLGDICLFCALSESSSLLLKKEGLLLYVGSEYIVYLINHQLVETLKRHCTHS